MIEARDKELQISWACSAQNPKLLPQETKKGGGNAAHFHAAAEAAWNE